MIFEEDIKNAITVLRAGGIILYPTDTIWGIGCDATNSDAVDKIFKIKNREETRSLLILVDSIQMAERYVANIPEIAYELTDVSDTPLTIIYPNGKNLAKGVCGADGSVGIRICNEEFCNELIKRFRKPIISTSANFSGKKSPESFYSIESELIEKTDYVVKYRQDDRQGHSPSPIIKFESDGSFKIIRK
jgi:L-threonylcarbamoyladenylate synthase